MAENKQDQFIAEYLKDFNATQSAKRAGYSPKTAYSQGHRLLKKAEVQEKIQKAIEEVLETQKSILKYKTLNELQAIAFSDVTEDVKIVSRERMEQTGIDEEGKPVFDTVPYQTVEFIDTEKSNQRKAIAQIKQTDKGSIELKFHDKTKALELIGKYLAIFTDNTQLTGANGEPIEHVVNFVFKKPKDADNNN